MAWTFELLAGPMTITEGPAWDGSGLFFTAIHQNRILRWDPATRSITTVYDDTGGTNGLLFAPDGRLFACEGTAGRMACYDTHGKKTILVSEFEGKRLNAPNDLALDSSGRIYFTDPRYGEQEGRVLNHDSVYRITPPGDGSTPWAIERMTFDTTRPNGILLSPDERTLYVAQSDYVETAKRELRGYPIQGDGSLGPYTVLHDFGANRGIDGMCFDTEGNIVATCGWELGGPGCRIAVFASDGTVLEEHPVPAGRPTNCTFGDADLRTLYVTTIDGHLYHVKDTGRQGFLQPPQRRPWLPS
jgi:gluconolactonase